MAKAKSQKKPAGKKKADKKGATDIDGETGEAVQLAMPAERDVKHYISEWALADKRVKDAEKARKKVETCMDEAGISVKEMKRAAKMKDVNPVQLKYDMSQLCMFMSEMGLPVQIQVFETRFGSAEAEQKARGYKDGKAGKDRDHGTLMKGSPGRRAYDEGYDEGQIENMPIDATAKAKALADLKAGRAQDAAAH